MSRVQTHGIILIAVFAVFVGISYALGTGEPKVIPVDSGSWLPMDFEGWHGDDLPPQDAWRSQLPNARLLARSYTKGDTIIGLLIVESADPGSFHSPMFCLPGSGWTSTESGVQRLSKGPVSKAEFVQDFAHLVVRYWYLAGEKLTAGLWNHKWNMLVNKFEGITGPNFSFRVTVERQGARNPNEVADEFANAALQQIKNKLVREASRQKK